MVEKNKKTIPSLQESKFSPGENKYLNDIQSKEIQKIYQSQNNDNNDNHNNMKPNDPIKQK